MNKVVKFEKSIVYSNGYFVPNMWSVIFSDGQEIISSFGDINGCLGIGTIEEIIGTDYEDFGFHDTSTMFYGSASSQIFNS